jgi:hypothetical protein
MSRVTFSALVAGMSGATADAVLSNWHGRPYVRQRVVPLNPNTLNQQAVRQSLGRLPELWRWLELQVKTVLDDYAISYRMSGYNWFVRQNRVKEMTYDTDFVTPPDLTIDPPATMTLTDLSGGSLKADWTGGTESAGHKLYALYRKVSALPADKRFTLWDHDTTLMSAHTLTKAAVASCTLRVFLIDELVATHKFSSALSKEIVMGA